MRILKSESEKLSINIFPPTYKIVLLYVDGLKLVVVLSVWTRALFMDDVVVACTCETVAIAMREITSKIPITYEQTMLANVDCFLLLCICGVETFSVK